MDHRHAVLADELQERLAGVEAVQHPAIGLVRVAVLVLVLIGLLHVEDAGDADDRLRVDQARRDDGGGQDRRVGRQLEAVARADVADFAVLQEDPPSVMVPLPTVWMRPA